MSNVALCSRESYAFLKPELASERRLAPLPRLCANRANSLNHFRRSVRGATAQIPRRKKIFQVAARLRQQQARVQLPKGRHDRDRPEAIALGGLRALTQKDRFQSSPGREGLKVSIRSRGKGNSQQEDGIVIERLQHFSAAQVASRGISSLKPLNCILNVIGRKDVPSL